jgi:hypothetical protein
VNLSSHLSAVFLLFRRGVFLAFLGLFLFEGSIQAGGLKWEQNTYSAKATPEDKKVEAAFVFTNTSTKPVEITNIRTSCGCTTAELPQKIYAPGEKGTVKSIFTIGGRKGLQEKTIIVQVADGTRDVLTMRVEIPDSLKINKEMLTWQVGDPLESQSFDVSVIEPGVKVKSVKTMGSQFSAELAETEPGKTYRIDVTPINTDRPLSGTIRLDVADPNPRAIYMKVGVVAD